MHFLNKNIVKMIEIHSRFYFLIRPITGMLPFDENRRFRDGSTSLACTYGTSLKPRKIRVANHTRFLNQTSKLKTCINFSQKRYLKPHYWQKCGKNPWKIENFGLFLIEFEDWDNYCFELPSWKILWFLWYYSQSPSYNLSSHVFCSVFTHGTEKLV